MSEISIEKKLELLNRIRLQNERDRFDMARREQIIYGKNIESRGYETYRYNVSPDSEDEEEVSTFSMRILLSLALFLMIIMCDVSGKGFLGINAARCFEAIRMDYKSSISAWVDAASESIISKDVSDGNIQEP